MKVFIPGSIPPVRFWPGGTDPPDGYISPVTYIKEQSDQVTFHLKKRF